VKKILVLGLLLAGCAGIPEPEPGRPVLHRDFPDPAVLRAPDGWYYAYATNSGSLNIQVARSRDLAQWQHLGDALPARPSWAERDFWAPHVIFANETYYMYYSAHRATGKCLAVATAHAPAGPFTDSGAPLICGTGIEHIDPMAFDDPRTGRRLLYWGSGPIRVQELAPNRLGFLPGSAAVELIQRNPEKPYRRLVEGAWVVLRDGWYYLFFSGDRCCDRAPHYAVMVARARDAQGPFEELEAPILEKNEAWIAPGHNSVATDDAGADWIVYHAVDPARQAARTAPGVERVMLIDRLIYRDGWPAVRQNARLWTWQQ
jgi:arabinan endo-1,5-alpha-L-arabinosidase